MARTYNQDCTLAHALDLLGERWTLLIVRELLLGPRRFGEIQAGLTGIGANLLSKRLRELSEFGLVMAPAPGDSGPYKLTEIGEELRASTRELMQWSIHYFLKRPEAQAAQACLYSNNLQPDSVALAIEIFAARYAESDLNYVARVLIDGFPYTLYYMNNTMTARRGGDAPAVATITGPVSTYMRAFRGELNMSGAKSQMTFQGDEQVIAHLLQSIVLDHDEKMRATLTSSPSSLAS